MPKVTAAALAKAMPRRKVLLVFIGTPWRCNE
jgi:hypothetical protein